MMPEPGFTRLQSLMWPDADLCADPVLTVRVSGGASLLPVQGLRFAPGSEAGFDTAFNIFALGRWRDSCGLTDLWLALEGQGAVRVTVAALAADRPWVPTLRKEDLSRPELVRRDLMTFDVVLAEGVPSRLDLGAVLDGVAEHTLSFHVQAIGPATLTGAGWETRQAALRVPELMLGVTTFRREAAATATAARFRRFAAGSPLGAHLHLVVVDNGQTLSLPPDDRVTLVPNRNLGGSGGFARCLAEAERRGATHALFMDDDASVDMEAIARVWWFLAYARDPATAVMGGLTKASDPTELWESGALIWKFCRARFRHVDLSSAAVVAQIETAALQPPPFNLYAGFWFFAFPLAEVRHWPFPFFVRGDDINFSLTNPFHLVTLPGVVSFQEMDFAAKESSMTLYLDLRHHLVQHLTVPRLDVGRRGLAYVVAHFFARTIVQSHMDCLATLNLAIEDVLQGPAFFAANADLAERRAEIARMRRYEVWEPLAGPPPKPQLRLDMGSRWQRMMMKLSLNGLLLPFFGYWGNRIVLRRDQRAEVALVWGAAEICYVDEAGGQMMVVRHRKWVILREGLRGLWNLGRLTAGYKGMRARWMAGFGALTSRAFWEGQFRGGV